MWPRMLPILNVTVLRSGSVVTYSISGTVYDADGATVVPGATVALGAYSAISGVDGTYTIIGIPVGTSGSMTCTKTGYVWTAITVAEMSGDLTGQDYTNKELVAQLKQVFGADEVWTLDFGSGTTVPAKVNSNRNGTEVGLSLQNAAGPQTGTLAALFGGSGDYANVYTNNGVDGLEDIWNGGLMSWVVFAKARAASVWTDGVNRYLARFGIDSNNRMWIIKPTSNNQLSFFYNAGGTSINVAFPFSDTDWFSAGMSIKDGSNGDDVRFFANGSPLANPYTGNGTYSGTLNQANTYWGAADANPNNVWDGWQYLLAVITGAAWTPEQFAAIHALL